MQASDDQTLSALRVLKQSGALRARDDKGDPLELDPAIAADLLNGEKVAPLPGATLGASMLNVNPLEIPRQTSPLPGLAREDRRKHRSSQEGFGTDALVRKLASDCESFNTNLVLNFTAAKENIQRDLLELFKTVSREKLPESFLRSLPKWGKGATRLHQVFNKSMARKRSDGTGGDQKEVAFDLVIQPDTLEEVDRDIGKTIDDELKQSVGEQGVIVRDMQRILQQVSSLMTHFRKLEERLAKEEVEGKVLQERLHDEKSLNKELAERVESLTTETRAKDAQMDLLREQFQRERDQARAKRADFFKEICRYKTQILHFTAQSDNEEAAARPKSPRRRDSGQDAKAQDTDMSFPLSTDQAEVQQLLEQREKEVRAECHEQFKTLKQQHIEQLKQLQQQKRVACDERDEANAGLLQRIKKLEFELVEERRKARKIFEASPADLPTLSAA
ncbi:hypothetical protein DIPPA_00247 [Diplonema papillatum]|nr:hypothetical protein DIPPA_00247 [Diplonema papillatum]